MGDHWDDPSEAGGKPAEQSAPGNGDSRARETRRRLLDAGWDLLNELCLAEMFGALTVDVIAERAERSERSFWNHFPDWQSYFDALIADVPHLHTFEGGDEWLPMATTQLAVSMLRCIGSGETFEYRTAKVLRAPSGPIAAIDDVDALAGVCRGAVMSTSLSAGRPAGGDEVALWSRLSEITATGQIQLNDDLQRIEVIGALAFSTNLALNVTSREDRGDDTQLIQAVDWLCELVRVARSDRWCAHSVLTERLCCGEDRMVITEAVELGTEFAGILGERRTSVHERVVNIALSTALSNDSTSPAEVAFVAISAHRGLSPGT